MLALKVTPIVGLPQFTGWSQVAESTASVSSRVICVFSVSGKHAGNVGRDISEQISDFYYYDSQQFHEFLQKLVDYAEQNSCKLYFAVAVLNKTRSIFATHGGSIFLKRSEKSGKILTSNLQIRLIEGVFQETDTFILTTQQADTFLSEIQQKYLQGFETDTIITSIVPGLHSQTDSSLSAIVFVSQQTQKDQVDDQQSVFQTEIIDESVDLPRETDLKGNPAADDAGEVVGDGIAYSEEDLDSDDESEKVSVTFEVSSSNKNVRKGMVVFKRMFSVILDKSKSILLAIFKLIIKLLKKIPSLLGFFKDINFKNIIANIKNRRQQIRLYSARPSSWKAMIIFGIALLAAGLIGYIFYSRSQEAERISSLVSPIQREVMQIREIAASDPISARDQLNQISTRLQILEEENQESSALQEILNAQAEVSQYLTEISGQEELAELDVYYDLRLVKSDYIASQIDFNSELVLLLDAQMKEVVLLNFESKEVDLRDFESFGYLNDAVLDSDSLFLLADGIQELPVAADSSPSQLRTEGDSNRTGNLIESYERFIYVLNPEKRNIYRYAESDGEYSEPIGWMRGAAGVEYEKIVSMRIDGDLWLSTQEGDIRKFTSGSEEDFEIRGLNPGFSSEVYLYTNENLENLYVLDPSANRVVVLTKTGDFIKEYISVSLGAANGIAVSEEKNRILITAGSLVYQIPITE